MKKLILLVVVLFSLAACDTFGQAPQPFPVWTAIPTRTPGIVTATPIILTNFTDTPNAIIITPIIVTSSETSTQTSTLTPTITASVTPTINSSPLIEADILGCDTGFDITHGMGEVTNAYITVKNTGMVDLPNSCFLLRALDEDREHPDKKQCVENLPVQYQVTMKLTVDSQYKADTIIQVDITTNDTILLRLDKQSCKDINLFGNIPSDLGVIKPVTP